LNFMPQNFNRVRSNRLREIDRGGGLSGMAVASSITAGSPHTVSGAHSDSQTYKRLQPP
jgi:hypothetical protein